MSNYTRDEMHAALGLPSLEQLRSGAIPEGVTALRSMEAGARAEAAAAAREATSMAREATSMARDAANLAREASGAQPRSEGSGKILGLPWPVWAVGAVAAVGAVVLVMRKKSSGESALSSAESLSPNRRGSRSPRRNPKPKTYYTTDGMPYAVEDVDLMSQSWFTGDRDPSGHEQMIAEIVEKAVQRGRLNPKRSGDILREARAEVRRILDRSPRRNPTTYVVEPECVHCGAPMGEGITGVREMREGDKLGERSLNDDEIPERFQVAAAHAHPRQAIKRWGTCRDCRDY